MTQRMGTSPYRFSKYVPNLSAELLGSKDHKPAPGQTASESDCGDLRDGFPILISQEPKSMWRKNAEEYRNPGEVIVPSQALYGSPKEDEQEMLRRATAFSRSVIE